MAVIKHDDQGNLQKEEFVWAYDSGGEAAVMAEQRQQVAGAVDRADTKALVLNCTKQRERTRGSVDLQALKACHRDASASKARLPQAPQTAPVIGNHVFRCLRWMG